MAKALGQAACRLSRGGKIAGNLEVEGEKKWLTEFRDEPIFVELRAPWRSDAFETEFSRPRVSYAGEKVRELRCWDRADIFTVVLFKAGEWEKHL